MKYLIYIFLLIPSIVFSQAIPQKCCCDDDTAEVCPTFIEIEEPEVTVAGSAEVITNASRLTTYVVENLDCEKKIVYEFRYTTQVRHFAGGGWGFLNIGNITGFTRDIHVCGTYRVEGNTNNPSNDLKGAMPDAPYTGKEAYNLLGLARIYLNQGNDRDNESRIYVEYKVRFIEN